MEAFRVLEDVRSFAGRIDQSPCDGCDGCGARCVDGVPMLLPEFEAIREYVAGADGAEARRVEQLDRRRPYPGSEDGAATYIACRFRDHARGRCTVYPVRPLVCRLFGHVEWLPCPIDRVPSAVSGGLAAMHRYGDAPQGSYEEWLAASSA